MPLRELGREIGLNKLDMPEDNDLGIDWETYGKRDVEILLKAIKDWLAFLRANDLGSFAPTLASQSMRAFRHKYMRHKIMIDDNVDALSLTRRGYYGGRCEAFWIGRTKGIFSLLDVNSMYPSVMARESFPYKLCSFTRYANVSDLSTWIANRCVTAEVELTTHTPFAPLKLGSKLIFPTGSFRCILSTPEIRYALIHAHITRVHSVAVYEKAPLFSHMMHELYALRQQYKAAGNNVYAFLCRKLINSFYGKWGQSGFKWMDAGPADDLNIKRWPDYDLETGKVTWYRQFGGLLQSKDTRAESYDSFPAIAAHVTAHARMVLWEIIQNAGLDNVYYCDTDSVLVNAVGRDRLSQRIDAVSLGFLSIKGEYEDIEVFGCKDYVFGSKYRCKGVRPAAVWLNHNTVEQDAWSGLRGLLASGHCDKPSTRKMVKRLSRVYDKGRVTHTGRVIPLLVSGDVVLN